VRGVRLIEAAPFDNTRSAEEQLELPEGFARWNHGDHLCVDVPDGGMTITCRTSQGKRVTFHFGVYQDGGKPQFVDVAYHDNGTAWDNAGRKVPTFDAIVMGGGSHVFDTRSFGKEVKEGRKSSHTGLGSQADGKAGIICVLIEDAK
jgi:hypothetical protein